MKLMMWIAVVLVLSAAHASAAEVGGQYREVQVNLEAGCTAPSGGWDNDLDHGAGIGLHLGVGLSQKVSCGFHFSYSQFGAERRFLPPFNIDVGEHDWSRYSGALFVEYLLTEMLIAPFIGGYVGMQGNYIEYAGEYRGVYGQGDFGFGFGLSAGLRYRQGRRLGFTARLLAENSPMMDSGWFVNSRLGLSIFL